VETIEHGTLLLHLGCEQAQGYGIARPMPACDFAAWAASWNPDPEWFGLNSVSSADLLLIFASVEHRAWIREIGEYLKGDRQISPPLDRHQCHFGAWLDADGQTRFGARPSFQAIDLLHRRVHLLGAEMCELHSQGRGTDALAKLGELHGLRDALLEQLKALEREIFL
jgi:hypothetical protein